jgi:uncharacterized membrane protein
VKVLSFIKRYWYIPLFVLAVILGWVIFRKRGTPVEQTRRELQAIEAGRRARELEERLGLEEAKKHLAQEYTEELNALDEKQKTKAKELINDPGALAKYLVRMGGGSN